MDTKKHDNLHLTLNEKKNKEGMKGCHSCSVIFVITKEIFI